MIVGGRYRQLLATSPDHFPMLMTEELQNRGICFLTPQSLASSISLLVVSIGRAL